MSALWMPGAIINAAQDDGGSMTGGEAIVTWHFYVAPYKMKTVDALAGLNRDRHSVHHTFHPITGEIGQMIPATRAGRGLKNAPGGVETNRRGLVHFQVEVIANSADWWKDLTPAGTAGLSRLMDYYRSWGVPDQWISDPSLQTGTPNGRSGHTSHRAWVENDHTDWLSKAPWELVAATNANKPTPSTTTASKPATTAPAALPILKYGSTGQSVKNVQAGLKPRFFYAKNLDVDGDYRDQTIAAVKIFQSRSGLPADGVVGPQTWAAFAKYGIRP